MKISIITIVYNQTAFIASCINSVINQTYADIEYIVIDGNSTDGTQDQIKKYLDHIDVYISEKDNGLYDALNKGIALASGEIIGILNSDDLFYNNQTLEKVVNAFKSSGADLIYANGKFVDKEDVKQVKRYYSSSSFQERNLIFGWIPLHTTIFVRKSIFKNYGVYKPEFKIASDYEISLRWFKNPRIKKYFLNEWVVLMRLGGLSTSPRLQLKKSMEDLKIIKLYRLYGLFTLTCKIGRKIPQYLVPKLDFIFPVDSRSKLNLE